MEEMKKHFFSRREAESYLYLNSKRLYEITSTPDFRADKLNLYLKDIVYVFRNMDKKDEFVSDLRVREDEDSKNLLSLLSPMIEIYEKERDEEEALNKELQEGIL